MLLANLQINVKSVVHVCLNFADQGNVSLNESIYRAGPKRPDNVNLQIFGI